MSIHYYTLYFKNNLRVLRKKLSGAGTLFVWSVLSTAISIACYDLGVRIWYDLHGLYNIDNEIYLAVARGILNGLVPYRDLFETKPPGMFLFNALSIRLSGDETIVRWLEAGMLILFPLITVLTLRMRDWLLRCMALLFGIVIAIYIGYESGELQTELFGSFCASIYVMLLSRGMSWPMRVLASLPMAAAIGFKEPFLFTMFAAALLSITSIKGIVYDFLIPLIIAAVIGIVVLATLGYLSAYVGIYLPFMLGFHVHRLGSPFIRGLYIHKLIMNLWGYSPFLALLIIGAWTKAAWKCWKQGLLQFGILISSLYITIFTIGSGGEFAMHHFIFAIPVYLALARAVFPTRNRTELAIIGILLILITTVHTRINYAERLNSLLNQKRIEKEAAKQVDDVMDRCHIDRYRLVSDPQIPFYGFTKHSPLGPAFFQYSYYMLDKFFKDSFVQNLLDANFLVLNKHLREDFPTTVLWYVTNNFTPQAPPCAGNYHFLPDHLLLFRKGVF